jgi:hypothetical protein
MKRFEIRIRTRLYLRMFKNRGRTTIIEIERNREEKRFAEPTL